MSLAYSSSSQKPLLPRAPRRDFGELGRELGITQVQVDRWNAFAAALEEVQVSRLALGERTRNCAMDAPADVQEVINMQVTWAQGQLSALTLLMQRTQALCEVLTVRQRQKANRLLQTFSFVLA